MIREIGSAVFAAFIAEFTKCLECMQHWHHAVRAKMHTRYLRRYGKRGRKMLGYGE